MKDIDKFKEFFNSMGITYDEWHREGWRSRPDCDVLTVTQCHFEFTSDGKYAGASPDEYGSFQPRKQ